MTIFAVRNRLRRRRGWPVVIAVKILDTAGGGDEGPEERGDPDGERVVGDGLVRRGKIRGNRRLEERLQDGGETDDTETDVEKNTRGFAQGVLVHEHQDTPGHHH